MFFLGYSLLLSCFVFLHGARCVVVRAFACCIEGDDGI